MRNNVFKIIQGRQRLMTIQSDLCTDGIKYSDIEKSELIAVVWKSPHASLKRNQQLEKDLYRIYRRYYIQVMLESFGRFW